MKGTMWGIRPKSVATTVKPAAPSSAREPEEEPSEPSTASLVKRYLEQAEGADRGLPYYGLDPNLYDDLVSGKIQTFTYLSKPPIPIDGWRILCRGLRLSRLCTINLSGTPLPDLDTVKLLCTAVECIPTLATLDVSDTQLNDETIEPLARALRIKGTIEHLLLPFNLIGPRGMFHLGRAMTLMLRLRTLDLSCNPLGVDGLRCLARSVSLLQEYGVIEDGIARVSPLERLYLGNTRIDASCAPLLVELLDHMHNLKKLHAPGNDFHLSGESYFVSQKARDEGIALELYMGTTNWQGPNRDFVPEPLTAEMEEWLEPEIPDPDATEGGT